MTLEEKAKAYDEAIKGIKDLITDNDGKIDDHAIIKVTDLKGIFPELQESNDEGIRKTLIELIKGISSWDYFLGISKEQMITWLEKQGEMKSDINNDILLRFAFYLYDDDTLYLSNVFVEECNRQHGYGTKILKAAEEVAKTFGISKIRLKVETTSWMEEWYKRNGYEYLTSEGKYDWLEKKGEQKQNVIDIISDLENYFATTTKEQQEEDWNELKKWEEKYFNHDKHIENSTDKVEPKFKVGDWIVSNFNNVAYIESISETKYTLRCKDGYHEKMSVNYIDECWHLWTIQDAKDGDVLANDHHILILKELGHNWASNGKPECLYAYCGIKPNGNFEFEKENYCFCGILHIHPATKGQRDLLFSKMKEAGYEWDTEKKELKKFEQEEDVELTDFESALFSAFSDAWQEYLIGKEVDVAKWAREHSAELLEVAREQRDLLFVKLKEVGYEWDAEKKELKKIEQKLIPKFKIGDCIYDKRDSYNRNVIREVGDDYYINAFGQKMNMAYTDANFEFLKHLEDDHIDSKSSAWSEEDEQYFISILGDIGIADKNMNEETYQRKRNWLENKFKSLKERHTWKPSKEQIEAFEHFVRSVGESGYASPYDNHTKLLYLLLEQLKKLREE